MKIKVLQRGDTIIEVMIAIIVLGAALGGAFAVANRSTKTVQANYERYQAQTLLNDQVELLRKHYTNRVIVGVVPRSTFKTTDTSSAGCFVDTAGVISYNAAPCSITRGGAEYQITVNQLPTGDAGYISSMTPADPLSYRITIEWAGLTNANDRLETLYGL